MLASPKLGEYRSVLQEMFPRQGKLSAYIHIGFAPLQLKQGTCS